MYSIYLGLAVGLLATIVLFVRKKLGLSGTHGLFSANDRIVLGGFTLGLCVVTTCAFISHRYIERTSKPEIYTLAAMRSTSGISGTFVYGSGSFGSSSSYSVYVKEADGALVPQKIAADGGIKIYEKDDLKGVGYWKRTVSFENCASAAAKWRLCSRDIKVESNELDVPRGTVLNEFHAQ